MFLIVGLGNPGREYANTRHNAGFMTLDILAERLGIDIRRRGFRCVYGEGRVDGERVVLAKPETFMNNSGYAAVELMNWYKVEHSRLLVIYDDADIPCGTIRIREKGSSGTHNGMRSIVDLLGFDDFPRIRVGIGAADRCMIGHVLGDFTEDEKPEAAKAVAQAAEAAELIVRGRISDAQAKFNHRGGKPKPKPAEAPVPDGTARDVQ